MDRKSQVASRNDSAEMPRLGLRPSRARALLPKGRTQTVTRHQSQTFIFDVQAPFRPPFEMHTTDTASDPDDLASIRHMEVRRMLRDEPVSERGSRGTSDDHEAAFIG